MSLIEHMQASMKTARGGDRQQIAARRQETSENVIVLDDVTPCYLKANAALHTCKAGLEVALHFLTDTEAMIDMPCRQPMRIMTSEATAAQDHGCAGHASEVGYG